MFGMCLLHQSFYMLGSTLRCGYAKEEDDNKGRKRKSVTPFLKCTWQSSCKSWVCTRYHRYYIFYSAWAKSTHQHVVPPKTQQMEHYQHLRKTSEYFTCHQHSQKLCLFRFSKVSIPVYLPCIYISNSTQ